MLNGTAWRLVLLTSLLSTAQIASAQTWIPLYPKGLPPTGHAVVAGYDARSNRLIVFFPGNSSAPGTQVWTLSHANGLGGAPTWLELSPVGAPPAARSEITAVYDEGTNELIVYGGCGGNCSPALPDVLVLSHANGLGGEPAWSQSTTNPAEPRAHHSAVYDSVHKVLIAFGGGTAFFGTDQNDTRVLSHANGQSANWTTLDPLGERPGVREGQSAIYDPVHNIMTVFGGGDAKITCCPYDIVDYNDTWTLSNANGLERTASVWTRLEPIHTPPSPRQDHSAIYDPIHNRMVVFGGELWSNGTQSWSGLGDVWQLTNANGLGPDLPAWKQFGQFGTPPGAKFGHAAGFDDVNQRMIVVGGEDGDTETQVLVFVLALNQQ